MTLGLLKGSGIIIGSGYLEVIPKPLKNAVYGIDNAENKGLGIGYTILR